MSSFDITPQELATTHTATLPPLYYRVAIGVLKPLYRLQVWRRSRQRDNYQQEVAQRFGNQYPPRTATHQPVIWCHAVSLGETNTVAPLLDALLAKGYQIWLTNTTQTGYARTVSRFADEIAQGRMSHSYVPVDSPVVIKTFLAHVRPVAALFVETELWANMLRILSEQNIPSILVNGRLSASSFTRYHTIGAVSHSMMQNLTLIIAQDGESAKRFRQLGAHSSQIRVAGSLKWVIHSPAITHVNMKNPVENPTKNHANIQNDDSPDNTLNNLPNNTVDSPLIASLKASKRPIWVAASTHKGEEKAIIALHQQLLSKPDMAHSLLIIVPRHPERFDEVATLIRESNLQMAQRSRHEAISDQTHVYLADTMGELMHWYALADVAFVGGSLVDSGGHNPIEPASVATPILMGHSTQSCQAVVDKLASVGALYQPNNERYQAITEHDNHHAQSAQHQPAQHQTVAIKPTVDKNPLALIYQQLAFWLSHPQLAKRAGTAGEQLTAQHQSVLTQQLAMIEDIIEPLATIGDSAHTERDAS